MDNTILGYNFLKHCNSIIDWNEGHITSQTNQNLNSKCFSFVKPDLNNPTQHLTASSRHPSLSSNLKALKFPSFSLKSINAPLTLDALLCSLKIGRPYKLFEANFFDKVPEYLETILPLIPTAFHKFAPLFSKVKADALPPQQACDHQIELTGDPPRKGGVNKLLDPKDLVLCEYISENIQKKVSYTQENLQWERAYSLFPRRTEDFDFAWITIDLTQLPARIHTQFVPCCTFPKISRTQKSSPKLTFMKRTTS